MAAGALDLVFIEFDAIVEAIGTIRGAEIGILMCQAGVGHRDRVVIAEVGADVFDGDIMGAVTIVAFTATHEVVGTINAHMQGGIFAVTPAIGFEYGHVHAHGAVMAGQA